MFALDFYIYFYFDLSIFSSFVWDPAIIVFSLIQYTGFFETVVGQSRTREYPVVCLLFYTGVYWGSKREGAPRYCIVGRCKILFSGYTGCASVATDIHTRSTALHTLNVPIV